MQSEPTRNSGGLLQTPDDYVQIPFDGFVNVNDIVNRRRLLRNAEFNTPEQSWDATLELPSEDFQSEFE
ncbi:hypothetical protein TH53_13260 [Pedobacter lusitanus]|uniref:Uncharacterized protein n=1 Tax=Pedobacter lusitanus TaxID=1503925 RepID=A0A0D0GKL7_9SPHI|nr:hypothetical protein [Pedobacter lusitanus]KIO76730.1 hypothetical protein TH53_13260 [Pedobacter lusitanus]